MKPRDVFLVCVIADVVFIGIFLLTAARALPGGDSLYRVFNPNEEANLFVAYAAGKLLFAAFSFFMAYLYTRQTAYLPIALIPLSLAFDEIGQLHESVGVALAQILLSDGKGIIGTPSVYDWPYLFGIPAAIGLFLFIWLIRAKWVAVTSVLLRLAIGVGVLLMGAIGVELLPRQGNSVLFDLALFSYHWGGDLVSPFALVEESIELIGGSVIAWSSACALWRTPFKAICEDRVLPAKAYAAGGAMLVALALLGFFAKDPDYPQKVVRWEKPGDGKTWKACKLPGTTRVILNDCSIAKSEKRELGYVTFGPYLTLPNGNYVGEITYVSDDDPAETIGEMDVLMNLGGVYEKMGKAALAGTQGKPSTHRIPFCIDAERERGVVEVRTFSAPNKGIVVREVRIARADAAPGSSGARFACL